MCGTSHTHRASGPASPSSTPSVTAARGGFPFAVTERECSKMTQETRRALAADARPRRPRRQRRRLGPVADDSDAINRLPRLSHSEQAELRAKHHAIALADQRVADLGRLMLAAEGECKANPTEENYQRMIEATKRYQTTHDTDRCVEAYLATERKVIASARAREAREVRRALARVTCRAPRRQRQQCRRRSHRTAARPTVGGDSGDDPPEPPGSRRAATGGVP